jgi:hypothetical protein
LFDAADNYDLRSCPAQQSNNDCPENQRATAAVKKPSGADGMVRRNATTPRRTTRDEHGGALSPPAFVARRCIAKAAQGVPLRDKTGN